LADPDVIGRSARWRAAAAASGPAIGVVALVIALTLAITTAPGPAVVVAAAVATVGLALDRRLGPLPAALLVVLSIPWARGADTLTWELAGLPIRPHDAVIGIGLLGALPVLWERRPRLGWTLGLVVALLILGVAGLVTGLLVDHPLRDVVRDVRWWAFYGAAVLALFGASTRATIMRGLLFGMTVFSIVVIVVALGPTFAGGLKEQELLYDRGTLRMQFANSAFLLPALAYVASGFLTRRRWVDGAWLLLLLIAVVLSLTRTSIGASALVILLVFVGHVIVQRHRIRPIRRYAAGALRLIAVVTLALFLGIGIDIAGTPPPDEVATSGGSAGEQPLDRILFQEERSDLGSLAQGRFPSYRAAWRDITAAPLTGAGMGSLTDVDYAYDEARANVIGRSPGVDNAYLTVGLKTGIPGMLVYGALILSAFLVAVRRGGRMARWYIPAWVGLVILSMTQAFGASLYGPFPLALVIALPSLTWGSSHRRRPDADSSG
jgi:O-antigen ligase